MVETMAAFCLAAGDDAGSESVADRGADDAKQHRGDDVARRPNALTRAQQFESLQAERRDGGEAAAQPDHDAEAGLDAAPPPAALAGRRPETSALSRGQGDAQPLVGARR